MRMRTLWLIGLAAALAGGCSTWNKWMPAPLQVAATPAQPATPRAVLALDPQPPLRFRCGERELTLRHFGELATLQADGRTFTLRPGEGDESGWLISVDDESTAFALKGDEARFELKGKVQPSCRRVFDGKLLFRARGNEPGWRLDISPSGLDLLLDNGRRRVFGHSPLIIDGAGVRSYEAQSAGGELTALVFERACADSLNGAAFPRTVEVRWQDRVLRGCGGDPATLPPGRF